MSVNAIDVAFRAEWSQLVATLVRDLGDLALAEDVAQEAFVAASQRWHQDGIPRRPGAWLLTTARRKAIDKIRRDRRFEDRLPILAAQLDDVDDPADGPRQLADDQLALIFGCCHPALDVDAQVALTLRYIGGLSTAQIGRAFLVPEPTMAKRLVRAKRKIRSAGIPFAVPEGQVLDERIEAVCGVIYAIFTEGHASTDGVALMRGGLCDEALWLAETLASLVPDNGDVRGLTALCLLTDSRRAARTDEAGQPVLLADQDRSLWDRDKMDRGFRHLFASQTATARGAYQLRASLAAVHATAPTYEETEWAAIVRIYDTILASGPNPIVALNRAAAVVERDGPEAGLSEIDRSNVDGALDHYHYFHSARAEVLSRLERLDAAHAAYDKAIETCDNDAERTWLQERQALLSDAR